MRRIILSLVVVSGLASPALAEGLESPFEPTGDPIGEIMFATDPGAMAPRYLRALKLQVGDRPTKSQLALALERLSSLPNLSSVDLKQSGSLLTLDLQEHPVSSFLVVPVPFVWMVSANATFKDWHVGDYYVSSRAEFGYMWDCLRVYDPRLAEPSPIPFTNNYVYGLGNAGILLAPDLRLQMNAEGYVSDIQPNGPGASLAGTYAPQAQGTGFSMTLGPELQYDNADDESFPRLGTRIRVGSFFGSPYLGGKNDFAIYRGELERYTPIGPAETIVTGVKAGVGRGDLPWNHKFWAGGIYNLRGYPYQRFMGDQLLVGTLEYRRRLGTNLVPAWMPGLGLTGGTFVDVGRAWESRLGTPFPQDIRAGVGGYLGVSLGAWNVGRLEVSYGTEGPYVGLAAGLPFDW
ncbi:MAG TPA: BamA/TamA family outer membrane protein [Stenomitos sp.]